MQSAVIDEILRVEEESRKMVEEASEKAQELVFSSNEEAQRIILDTVKKAREDGEHRLEEAQETYDREIGEYTKALEEKSEGFSDNEVKEIADKAFELISFGRR